MKVEHSDTKHTSLYQYRFGDLETDT